MWEDHRYLSTTYKGTSGGLAISLSACDDHQSTLDTMVSSQFMYPVLLKHRDTSTFKTRRKCMHELHPQCDNRQV